MVTTYCAHYHVTHCGLVLPSSSVVEEEGSRETTLGLQSLPTKSPLEVREMLAQLLLFAAVSERFVAHCPQARLLQT